MMYGATGSLDISEVFKAIAQPARSTTQVLVFGLVFIVAGLGFKLGAAPFHMWVPGRLPGRADRGDAAHRRRARSSPPSRSRIRLLVEGLLRRWRSTGSRCWRCWRSLSLLVGNLAAIAQTNLKRMLAYSTIAQIGFMLLGLCPAWSTATRCSGQRLQRGDVLHRHLRADDARHASA